MQQTAQTARALAAQLLVQCEQRRSYANLALDSALKKARFLHADAAFCTALVYGVVERRRTLDFQAADLLRQPLQKLPPATRAALRLGLYQLFYMDRIPDHAAIGESVELVKNLPQARHTAGLVNAVLRRARERGLQLPAGSDDEALAVRYACPAWLVRLWRESYPEDYIALLAGSFGTGETVLRVNTTRTTPAALLAALPNETGARGVASMPEALQLSGANVTQLPGFAEGHFHVQDLAAQLCCRALDPRPGNTVFDLCAAPGGKTFTLAEMMQDTGRVIAVDLHKNRVRLVAEGAARLGLRCVEPRQGDALRAADLPGIAGYADRVLCDVPCSGLGILRKKPDIREKLHTELDKLPEMQYAIVCAGAACVAQEGVLVYATCTLRPAENEEVCRRFLRAHPGFAALPVLPEHETGRRAPEGFLTLMPHLGGTDGFFIAKFGRKKESHD